MEHVLILILNLKQDDTLELKISGRSLPLSPGQTCGYTRLIGV
jgi:hypothetical protein